MKKLLLNHITPYADKALYGLFNGKKDIVTEIDFENGIISSMNNGNVLVKDFIPLLMPLSYLTKKITHQGKEFIPLAELLIAIPEASFRFRNHKNTVIRCWEDKEGGNRLKFCLPPIMGLNEYQHVQKIIEWHFDFQNLIPQKLACDKTKFNK